MLKESKNSKNNFKQKLWENGFTDLSVNGKEKIAVFFKVTPRTINRWIKNDSPPKHAIKAIEEKSKKLNDHWENFRITKNTITTPNGYTYTAKQLENLSIEIARIKALYATKENF